MNSQSKRKYQLNSATACSLLIVATLLIYSQSLFNGFHFDDFPNIVKHRDIQLHELTFSGLIDAARTAILPTRIIPNMSFAIDWWRGAGNPAMFQQTNIAIHAINGLLVYFLLLAALSFDHQKPQRHHRWAVLISAAIWLLHPIQVQSVTYIVQRMTELAALFTLSSCLFYLYARKSAGRQRFGWITLSGLAAICAAVSKENSWILPLLIIVLEFWVCRQGKPIIRGYADVGILLLPLIFAVYILADLALSGPFADYLWRGYQNRDFTLTERLLTQPRIVFFHFSQWLWPLPERFSLFHDIPLSTGLLNPVSTLLALMTLLLWTGAAILALNFPRLRIAGFLMLWVPITLVIESSVIPLMMVFEHRMYLPSVGLAGLIAFTISRLYQHREQTLPRALLLGTGAAIIIALSMSTMTRIPHWQSERSLYTQAARIAPENPKVFYNYANILERNGESEQAKKMYLKALELAPGDGSIHNNFGLFFKRANDFSSAIKHLRTAIRIAPQSSRYWFNLGSIHQAAGEPLKAIDAFNRVIAINPEIPLAHRELGESFYQVNELNRSLAAYQKSLELDRHNPQSLLGIAKTLFSLNQAAKAMGYLKQASANNFQVQMANEIGQVFAQNDRLMAAKQSFTKATKLAPRNADAHSNLGAVMLQLGDLDNAEDHLRKALSLVADHPQAQNNWRHLQRLLNSRNRPSPKTKTWVQ